MGETSSDPVVEAVERLEDMLDDGDGDVLFVSVWATDLRTLLDAWEASRALPDEVEE